MKFCLCFFVIISVACSAPQKPEFIKLHNIVPLEVGLNEVRLSADALFNNPNSMGLKIANSDITVSINGSPLSKVEQKISASMIPKGEFGIPMIIKFKPRDVLRNKSGIINSVMNTLLTKEIELLYQGNVYVELAGQEIRIPVDHRERVLLER